MWRWQITYAPQIVEHRFQFLVILNHVWCKLNGVDRTLDKSLELVRPTSDVHVTGGEDDEFDDLEELQLPTNNEEEDEEEYDPEALLKAVSDWKKNEESLEEALATRLPRRSLIIPVWDPDVKEQRAKIRTEQKEVVGKKEEKKKDEEESKEHEAEIWKSREEEDDHHVIHYKPINMKLSATAELRSTKERRNPVEAYIEKRKSAAVEAHKRRKQSFNNEHNNKMISPRRISKDVEAPNLTVVNRQGSNDNKQVKKVSLTTLDLKELGDKLVKIPRHMLSLSEFNLKT